MIFWKIGILVLKLVQIFIITRSEIVFSCPIFISKDQLAAPELKNSNLEAYIFDGLALEANKKWQKINLQTVPFESATLGTRRNKKEKPYSENSSDFRAMIKSDRWGTKFSNTSTWPCKTNSVFELRNLSVENEYIYIADCISEISIVNDQYTPVKYDASQYSTATEWYDFRFYPSNFLLFKEIFLNEKPFGKPARVVSGSDIKIHIDLKHFFTLEFDKDDILASLREQYQGPIGLAGRMESAIKVLFFKVDLKADTFGTFFSDGAHLPLRIVVPLDANKYVNRKTGIIYTFKLDTASITNKQQLQLGMPYFQNQIFENNGLKTEGLKYCQNDDCIYKLAGNSGSIEFEMFFTLHRYLVEDEFSPFFVENVAQTLDSLGWDYDKQIDYSKMRGVYFELSNLKKGDHNLDFWIRIKKPKMPPSCPHPVAISRIN